MPLDSARVIKLQITPCLSKGSNAFTNGQRISNRSSSVVRSQSNMIALKGLFKCTGQREGTSCAIPSVIPSNRTFRANGSFRVGSIQTTFLNLNCYYRSLHLFQADLDVFAFV